MARHSQRYRETSLPFRYRGDGLDFDLEGYSLDGGKPRDVELKPGEQTVDLAPTSGETDSLDDQWNTATIFGRLKLPEDVVTSVLPSDEHADPPVRLYVTVRCHETIYRDRVDVQSDPAEPGEYDVRVKLNWEDVRGTVELRPYLVRATECTADTDGHFATTPNVRVASGDRYEVVVDHWDDDEPAAIDGEEVSFSQSDHLPDGEKLYHLDFRNEARPKLWINADHPRITDVLQTDGSIGAEPRLRDMILDQISYGVWTQLILRTATAIDDEGDVEYEWQQNVVQGFVRDLYDVDDATEAAHLIREDAADADGLARLTERIDHGLQDYIEPRTQLINLMEEGLRI